MKIVEPSVTLIDISKNAAEQIEIAGRTCYKSEGKTTDDSAFAFVRMLNMKGHHAMLEFATATFRVVTDRGISHEIVRHRIASFAQESTRYCNYSKKKFDRQVSFIVPSSIDHRGKDIHGEDIHSYLVWHAACEAAEKAYFELLDAGQPPQVARSVLPTCLKTEIVISMNFRSWLNFLHLRDSPHAHPDMQHIAKLIGHMLIDACPAVFFNYPRKGANV